MHRLPTVCFLFFLSFILFFPQRVFSASSDKIIVKFKNNITQPEKESLYQTMSLSKGEKIPKINADVFKVDENKLGSILTKLSKNPKVQYAEPDYKVYVSMSTNDPGISQSLQWGMYKIQSAGNSLSAWDLSISDPSVKVAILDTGIDQNHDDLKSKIVASNNCTNSSTVSDLYGHGTHVAGIADAVTNNGVGVGGAGFNASLMNIKVLGDDGSGYYSWISNCLYWAADNGANVINMSFGSNSYSQTLEDAVNYAWNKGVLLSAAAGNNGSSSAFYPAYFANVIAVAATDSNDNKASFSNYGSWVDVAAPGVNIYSTMPTYNNSLRATSYGYLSGTSMASPHVAGLAALLFSIPGNNNSSVRKYIETNSDKINGTGFYWTGGRINALKSVQAALPSISQTPTPTLSISLTPTSAPTVTLSPTVTPTRIPTPTPTIVPSKTPTPTPNIVSPTPRPKPWWCVYFPTSFWCR